jgi:mRNA interferase RelE/StbE
MMAARALRRHANRADMISDEIRQYAADPLSLANNVKVLAGADALRLRVGDFRILFTETNDTITILDIGPRGEIYS